MRAQEFTTPGAVAFLVPTGVKSVLVTMSAAGGSGGGRDPPSPGAIGGLAGGGAGEWCRRVPLKVTPGDTIVGSVGAGGARGLYTSNKGQDGGSSTFGPYTCLGGYGGTKSPFDGVVGSFSYGGTSGGGYGVIRVSGFNWNNVNGDPSLPEYLNWNYGASGGGNATTVGKLGGACEGHVSAAGGAVGIVGGNTRGGGSGGGASPYGTGGAGGNYDQEGFDAAVTAYGAGGGGAGGEGGAGGYVAGAGAHGYILLEWEDCE